MRSPLSCSLLYFCIDPRNKVIDLSDRSAGTLARRHRIFSFVCRRNYVCTNDRMDDLLWLVSVESGHFRVSAMLLGLGCRSGKSCPILRWILSKICQSFLQLWKKQWFSFISYRREQNYQNYERPSWFECNLIYLLHYRCNPFQFSLKIFCLLHLFTKVLCSSVSEYVFLCTVGTSFLNYYNYICVCKGRLIWVNLSVSLNRIVVRWLLDPCWPRKGNGQRYQLLAPCDLMKCSDSFRNLISSSAIIWDKRISIHTLARCETCRQCPVP